MALIRHTTAMKPGRPAFTLIELLVSMALTVFVMVILTEAFTKGLDTFSGLKSIGDLQENLRVGTSNVRNDLAQDHFDGKRRVSDPNLWSDRPRNGFLAVYQLAAASPEGTVDGIPSVRTGAHIIHMAVKRKGNRLENFFAAPVPAGSPLLTSKTDIFGITPGSPDATLSEPTVYRSQWAEVAYFMIPAGTTEDPTGAAGSVPAYKLYRLELVVVPDPSALNAANIPSGEWANYRSVCCYPNPANTSILYFPSPADLLDPARRAFKPASAASYVPQATLVMSEVISFQVQGLHYWPAGNTDAGFFDDFTGGVFDTGAATYQKSGVEAVLRGISITIRAWDRGYGRARQVTVIQDL